MAVYNSSVGWDRTSACQRCSHSVLQQDWTRQPDKTVSGMSPLEMCLIKAWLTLHQYFISFPCFFLLYSQYLFHFNPHLFFLVKITFANKIGKFDLEVTTFQMAVLFAWNERPHEKIAFENLRSVQGIFFSLFC